MSLTRTLKKITRVISKPAEYADLIEVNVERVIDDNQRKTVTAIVTGIGSVVINDLSNKNYNSNPKWSDDELLDSLISQIAA